MPLLSPSLRAELSAALGLKSLRLRAELRALTRVVKNLRRAGR